jgi:ribosomal protein S18 acetylase RimI-like enzyme
MRDVMGDEIFGCLYGDDWRRQQQEDVEKALRDEKSEVWVAEVDGEVAGFVSAVVDANTHMGEIYMVAVDPDFQNHGLGTQLTDVAID